MSTSGTTVPASRSRFGPAAPTAIILLFFALDQLTKWLIIRTYPFNSENPIIPGFFTLVYWGNTGAAFSFMSDNNVAFLALSAVTLLVLTAFAFRGAFREPATRFAVCLLVAGVMGNAIDRIRHHYVVDFLLFYLHVPGANPWPAFNVADSCICVAATIFIVTSWLEDRKQKRSS